MTASRRAMASTDSASVGQRHRRQALVEVHVGRQQGQPRGRQLGLQAGGADADHRLAHLRQGLARDGLHFADLRLRGFADRDPAAARPARS